MVEHLVDNEFETKNLQYDVVDSAALYGNFGIVHYFIQKGYAKKALLSYYIIYGIALPIRALYSAYDYTNDTFYGLKKSAKKVFNRCTKFVFNT